MNPIVRLARPDETSQLAALAIQVWLDTYATEGMRQRIAEYVLRTFTPPNFDALLADEGKRVVVAELTGHLLGYAVAGIDALSTFEGYGALAELETLHVSRHFQRKGIGRALLAQVVRDAGLWVAVWHRNRPALSFYQSCGFVAVGASYFELDGELHENRVLARAGRPVGAE